MHDRLTFDAVALLEMLERRWAPELRRVSLVTEVDAPEVMVHAAADGLGKVYRRPGGDREIARRWPGCVAVALTGVAAAACGPDQRPGAFWAHWWAACHVRGRARDATAFGEAFCAALRVFDLPGFPEVGEEHKNAGLIMMHAAIPTPCLAGFFGFLLGGQARDPGLDGEAVLEYVARGTRLNEVSEPVRGFLRYGGDYAQDMIDRCLDLLNRVGSPEAGAGGESDLEGLGLPSRIVEHAQGLARDGLLAAGWQAAPDERPRLALDPFGQGIHLVLPLGAQPESAPVWTVTTGADTTDVGADPRRRGPVVFPLPRPVRGARVTRHGAVTELDLVDPADPLLIFTEDGRYIPPHRPLPPEAIWVAHPADRALTTGNVAGAQPRVVAESRLPLGWAGWRLAQISLDDAVWLALDGDVPRREVRGRNKPRVLTGEPLPGVTTADGSPVFTALPAVWLPGGTEAAWSISVRQSGGGPPVRTGSQAAPRPTEVADLWPQTVGRPVLGTFVITVRGPIGRGIRRTVTLAEGLGVRYEPPVRLLHADGLGPARALLSVRPGMEVAPQIPDFTGRTREQTVTAATARQDMSLTVTPPHMRVLAERTGGRAGEWSAAPLRLDLAELDEIEALRVEIPGLATAFPLGVVVGGLVVQEVARSARGRHSLRRVLDTVIAHGGADVVVPATVVSPEAVPVARVEPAGPADDPWLDVEWSPRRTP